MKEHSRKFGFALVNLHPESPKTLYTICQNKRVNLYFSTFERAEQFGIAFQNTGMNLAEYEITAISSPRPLKGIWDITVDELLTPQTDIRKFQN